MTFAAGYSHPLLQQPDSLQAQYDVLTNRWHAVFQAGDATHAKIADVVVPIFDQRDGALRGFRFDIVQPWVPQRN